jgi:hypothetical protein
VSVSPFTRQEGPMLFRTVFGALTLVGFMLQRGRIATR